MGMAIKSTESNKTLEIFASDVGALWVTIRPEKPLEQGIGIRVSLRDFIHELPAVVPGLTVSYSPPKSDHRDHPQYTAYVWAEAQRKFNELLAKHDPTGEVRARADEDDRRRFEKWLRDQESGDA